jgi:hypothetical protein
MEFTSGAPLSLLDVYTMLAKDMVDENANEKGIST